LRVYENAFGVEHINCTDAIHNLGLTYRKQGKYEKAITQHQRALRIKEKTYGVDHINCAETIYNLGTTYYSH